MNADERYDIMVDEIFDLKQEVKELQGKLSKLENRIAAEGFPDLETMISKYKTVMLAANEISIETDEEIESLKAQLAERDGRCVILPCRVGDTVYKVSYDCAKGVRFNPFNEYGCSTAEICLKCDTYPCDLHRAVIPVSAESEDWIWKNKDAFGKTVFLTREEAETALKGEEK